MLLYIGCVCVCVCVCTFQLILVFSDYYCINFQVKSTVQFLHRLISNQNSMCIITLSHKHLIVKKLLLIGLLILPIDSC